MTLGILGGSFNPPHPGHLGVARAALAAGAVSRVLFVPCAVHAFGKPMENYIHRLEMCRRLVCGEPDMDVSDIEGRIDTGGRTLLMLRALRTEIPDGRWRLLLGADVCLETDRWYQFDEVKKMAPPLYVGRRGVPVNGPDMLAAPVEVSSSDIRRQLAQGQIPADLLCEKVRDYIVINRLYGVE